MNRVYQIVKESKKIGKTFNRKMRKAAVEDLFKVAQSDGMLDRYNENILDYPTRKHITTERGGPPEDRENLYGVGLPDHKNTDLSTKEFSRSLSTRHSPDHVGVQVRRIADGVYQDPITNKIYDWNEGFKSDEGEEFAGGGVSLQTDIYSR